MDPLRPGAPLADYRAQARTLGGADPEAELARWYSFRDWPALVDWVTAVNVSGSPVQRFELAVEAVITGHAERLKSLLAEDPELVHARSSIISNFAPPRHRATLLHYVAANGVEQYRQKTPPNAVEVARILLRAGAEPDALAFMYSGQVTTLSMLVSSVHPAAAGLQAALTETLLDFGAAVDGRGSGEHWVAPLLTALAFGYPQSAHVLVRRGASITTVAAAAGLGRRTDIERLLPKADALDRHRATALAAQHGHTQVLKDLLEAGEDPNRFNPPGFHAHSTPLHQAAYNGHLDAVVLLVAHGARGDIRDLGHHATPLGWAAHAQQTAVVEYLRSISV